MNQGGGHSTKPTDEESVFCDTGILINYMNLEWERDHTNKLLEDHSGDVVISESVEEEFSSIIDRRADIYLDFLEFVLANEDAVEEFSPRGKRTANDHSHIVEIQQQLSTVDHKEVARRLRRFSRRYEKQAEHLLNELIAEVIWTAPPMMLTFALEDVMDNANDATIVSEAADWSNEGGDGNFAALDKQDILNLADEINGVIEKELDPAGRLNIGHPSDLVPS